MVKSQMSTYFLDRSILGCTNNSIMDLNKELLRQLLIQNNGKHIHRVCDGK